MKKIHFLVLIFLASITYTVHAQPIDSIRFFTDDSPVEMSLTTDIRALQKEKGNDQFQDASVSFHFADGTVIDEQIQVGARGVSRRAICKIPPMMLNFRNSTSPRLHSLGKLKLVIGCGSRSGDEELVFKEYLIYKMYNLFEDKSFRVRLLKTTYNDSKNKMSPFTQYSFLIEDDADMARRNGCKKRNHSPYGTEATNRDMMTMVALFEYMVGNTDWSIPNEQNVKLIFDRKDTTAPPYVVPYDFDYSGLVNAGYAEPHEAIGTTSVTERVYRGFARTLEEIQNTLAVFKKKKESVYSLVTNFSLLSEKTKKQMTRYLDDFFEMIDNEKQVKSTFVDNVRTR